MTRACTLAAVRESLTPEQWASLERINPHLRPATEKALRRGELVDASAHRDGPVVTVVAKGLRLRLLPNELKGMHPLKEARLRRAAMDILRALARLVRGSGKPAGGPP